MVSVALYNLKGGVGKTAATVNLAYLGAADGLKTVVWDLDPQGSSSFYLNVEPTTKNETRKLLTDEMAIKDAVQDSAFENLWAIPSDLSARNADVVLDEMKKSKKKSTTLSIKSFDIVMNYFNDNELDTGKIRCFFSMVDHRKNMHHEVMEQFYKDKLFFKNYIPYLSDVEKMGNHQQPIFEFANSSYAAQCYRDLWNEIKKTCL